jgi:hypothetical protein
MDLNNHKYSKEQLIDLINLEINKEKTRKTEIVAYITANNLYNMLILNKKEVFIKWMQENKGISLQFHDKLEELCKDIIRKDKREGVNLCQKFMYSEKNRRNMQISRNKIQKVVPEKTPSYSEKKKNIINGIKEITSNPINIIIPKQWKVSNIYNFIKNGNEEHYISWCKENNDITDDNINNFILCIKNNINNETQCTEYIEKFIIDLRKNRTLVLLQINTNDVVERDDRQQWPSSSVLKAYKDGRLSVFKKFTEEYAGDSGEKWEKRWAEFENSLANKSDDEAITLISKFMAAQRKKKYHRNKVA